MKTVEQMTVAEIQAALEDARKDEAATQRSLDNMLDKHKEAWAMMGIARLNVELLVGAIFQANLRLANVKREIETGETELDTRAKKEEFKP